MNIITLENISKSYSEKVLLNNVSLGINEGDKIGLIGINGAGKSTFLKIVSGREDFFEGTRIQGKNVRIEYLSQDNDFDDDTISSKFTDTLKGLDKKHIIDDVKKYVGYELLV